MNFKTELSTALVSFVCASFVPALHADTTAWLEDQDMKNFCLLSLGEWDYKQTQLRKSVAGTTLKMNGFTYEHGVGIHVLPEKVRVADFFPGGKAKRFKVKFGLDDQSGEDASAVLNLYADEKLVATSGIVKKGEPVKEISVDMSGVLVLSIELKGVGTDGETAFADLADAAFVMEDGAKPLSTPESFTRQLGILTPKGDGRPRVNGPCVYGVRPKKQLLYRVPVSGDRPMEISVDGLPAGTYFDAERQQLRGVTPAEKGDYPLVVRARNAKGAAEKKLTLRVGSQIGLTPPMGWNSWNTSGPFVTEQTVKDAVDGAIKFGLVEHGWQYFVLDDGWACSQDRSDVFGGKPRDEKGRIIPNSKFPDMKALADYVHDRGYKFGIYSSPGAKTCFGLEGSWMHEWIDARQFMEWGVDYLKYDCCGYASQTPFENGRFRLTLPWMMMGKALQEGDRDIFYSISGARRLGIPDHFKRCGGNSVRITGDVFNSWPLVRRSMIAERYYWNNTSPGHWCDPDMLVLQTSWPRYKHKLTQNEFYTHFSLWCLYSAPLMMGYPIMKTTPLTLSMLTNDEVLEVNQDELGLCAALIQTPGRDEVWAKPMSDGSIAVGLVNMGYTERKVKFCFKKAGMRGKWRVRDLWRQKDEGVFENCYEASIPGHATQLVRIWPTEGAKFDDDVTDIRDFAWMRLIEEERPLKPGEAGCIPCAERKERVEETEQVEVRVRDTPSGPQIQVDGKSITPRICWSFDNPKRRPVDGTWRRHTISFTPRADAAMCKLELYPQTAPGRFFVRGIDTNAVYRAERDKTLTFDFEARSEGDITYFRPLLAQLEPLNDHYEYHRMLSVTPDDPDDSVLISECIAARRAGVRMFSFFAPNIWPVAGEEPEYAAWDKTCDAILAAVPDALLIPRVTINPPFMWLDARPEAKMVSEKGEALPRASINSPEYKAAALDFTRKAVRHFMDRYPRQLAGVHITGQNSQEWYYWYTWEGLTGYDEGTRVEYRRWLKEHGLPEADVPTPAERRAQDLITGIIDPASRPNVVNFNRFLTDAMVDFMGEICKATREASEGKKLVFAFHGYAYELVVVNRGVPSSGNCDLQRVFDKWADYIDILCAPVCYSDRAWLGTTPAIGPIETVNRNGMLWLNENDMRTHLVDNKVTGDGAFDPLYTPQETDDALTRSMLQDVVRGAADWWMDHGEGWFDSWDEVWKPLSKLDALDQEMLKRRRPYTPEVAVVADDDSMMYFGTRSARFAGPLVNLSRRNFPRAGVSYGQYILEDVLRKPLPEDVKLIFHPCTVHVTPEKERRLAEARRRSSPKIVRAWCHMPGVLSDGGIDVKGVERLTGFEAELVPTGKCMAAATELGRSLGLPESFGSASPVGRLIPRLKEGDEVWAKWSDGSPAVVVRSNGKGGADVLVGTVELPTGLIYALAKRAGARSAFTQEEVGKAVAWWSDELEAIQSHSDDFRDFRKGEVRYRKRQGATH